MTEKDMLEQRSNSLTRTILNEGFFATSGMKINCCFPVGYKLLIGTNVGVYITERQSEDFPPKPIKLLDIKSVTQIEVLEQLRVVLVLSNKNLYYYSTDLLETKEPSVDLPKQGKKICSASFFKIGILGGENLLCCVKATWLSSTIKLYRLMLVEGQDFLKSYKEFYIPAKTYSVYFLRQSLCVGRERGFDIVHLDPLASQLLLDEEDPLLDFVTQKKNLKPIHLERFDSNFLLCYSDCSIFIDKHGKRARTDWKIDWKDKPEAIAIIQSYILAFEPSFVEIWNMKTATLVQILEAKNSRMLHASTREILFAFEDRTGKDVIASLGLRTDQTCEILACVPIR